MKNKSIIGAALAAIVTLGVTTSCADMFDIESTRVAIEKNHQLDSSADSAYSTFGVLQCMREIADRYIVLGEVRGDLVEINEYTKTSIRNLAEFNFDEENEYLNVRDYYAVINNCNYILAKMDTTIAHNNERVMIDEYAALIGVRAWTYLQLAINHGKVPFYLTPITSVAESEAEYPLMNVKEIAAVLIPQLIPYLDYDLPYFVKQNGITQQIFPPLRLVLADFYLWSGDYENACKTYLEYLTTNEDFNYSYGDAASKENFRGFMGLNGSYINYIQRGINFSQIAVNWQDYQDYSLTTGYENIAYIPMERTTSKGVVSEVGSLFASIDGKHSLNPSTYLKELSGKQAYIKATTDANGKEDGGYTANTTAGDRRYSYYHANLYTTASEEPLTYYDKLAKITTPDGATLDMVTQQINLYRRSIVYLRAAEALNSYAKQEYVPGDSTAMADARNYATMAFNLMHDAYKVFFPNGHTLEKELKNAFLGVHARGCGDVRLDTTHFTLRPAAIARRFEGLTDSTALFIDTIRYIDELIIDELALESAAEGNRFGDLVRFAERRKAWGEADYADLLAKRVASRKGELNFDNEIYNKLTDETNWYLPLK